MGLEFSGSTREFVCMLVCVLLIVNRQLCHLLGMQHMSVVVQVWGDANSVLQIV